MGIGRRAQPSGRIPSRYMLIGEAIGKDGAKYGRVFAGKVGRELDRFLDGIRLPARHEWYLTEWIKDWGGEEYENTQADFDREWPILATEIQAVRPEIVVTFGRHVARAFLGDVDMEEVHGIPWRLPAGSEMLSLVSPNVVVVPIYNPAAGFRSPELSASVAYDFSQLEGVIDGTLSPRVLYDDPIPDPDYHVIETVDELDEVMINATRIATDSEGMPWEPWSVQITVRDGEAFVLRVRKSVERGADTRHVGELLDRFAYWVNTCGDQYVFTFHNALHDLAVFRSVGIETSRLNFDDTMLMSYALQLEPQGLKPLCARHCGMKMEHYDEVMGDASYRLAVDWLLAAQQCEDDDYEARCHEEFVRLTTTPYVDKKGKTKPGRRLKVAPKLPRSPLHKSIERCLKSSRPRGLWDDQLIDLHVEAGRKYGRMWEATLDHVPADRAIRYAGRDSDGTHRLFPRLEERVRANELWDVYRADLATVPLIDRMQQTGIRPDLGHFARLSDDLVVELQAIRDSLEIGIERAIGRRADGDGFNPNSGAQTADLLFGQFGLEVVKRTREGDPSTNDKVLEALEKDGKVDRAVRDIIADIRQYREVYKLKHTFVDQIPDFVHRWPHDGRIHATFRITRVVTGRLAASDPNLLALPKHGKFAKRFRSGFVGSDRTVIASWDLSQIELRVLAHLSQDPVLLHAFRNGIDLHATLAQRIFGVDPKLQDKSKHRLPAKAINFGIPMGMTNIGLCLELRKNGVDVDENDAQRWLDETMALYAEVPRYQQGKIAEAKRYGFVTDLRGRRRYIGGIRSFDDAIRSEAERFAFSTPIQAGAQEVMKEAEAYVYRDILLPAWKAGNYVEPLVQIHDDLVLEPDRRHILDLNAQMIHAMTKVPAHWLSVPIETSGDYGENWGDLVAIVCPACQAFNETLEHKTCRLCGSKID